MASLGIGLTGGVQVGYASLVDLKTGQIAWFNRLIRALGDMREQEPATLSIDLLLENFPALAELYGLTVLPATGFQQRV